MLAEYIMEKKLVLLSLNGSTELKSGDYIVAANFGEVIDNTPEIASRMEISPGSNPSGPRQIGTPMIIIFLKLEYASPFTVGTTWKLSIDKAGSVSLTKD